MPPPRQLQRNPPHPIPVSWYPVKEEGAELLRNPTRINQILCLGKGGKLLKLYTRFFPLCFREM